MPSGWRERPLGSFTKRVKEINLDGRELEPLSVTKGQGVVLQSSRFKKRVATDLRKYQIARRGDFIYDPMSLYYGSVGRLDVIAEGVTSPDYVVFQPDGSVDSDFLLHLLRWPRSIAVFEAHSERGNRAGKRRRLYWSGFKDIAVHLPPLSEQQKIAAILSSVDEAIEATQAVIDRVQVVKKGLMQELLTKGLPGRHKKFKQTELGQVPEEWEVVELGSRAEFQAGYAFKSKEFSASGDRLLRGSNVGVERLDWSEGSTRYFPSERRDEFSDYILDAGDIVVAMDRPFISSGFKAARIGPEDLPALLLQRVGRFRRLRGLDADYLWVLVRSRFVGEHLLVQQKGTDLPHISRAEIEASLVPIPGIGEQQEIAAVVSSVEDYARELNREMMGFRDLKSGLMSVLLTGELRVPPEAAG